MAETEIIDALRTFLEGGQQDGFGTKDPWASLGSGGDVEDLLAKLAVNVSSVEECPDEDCALSAMQMGQVVANADLTPKETGAVRTYMMIAYQEHMAFYREGVSTGKIEAEESKTKTGAHGGSLPSKDLAQKIEQEKGMPWQAVVVVTSVLYRGAVPTATEIDKYGYGSDPSAWPVSVLDRKAKRQNFADFLMKLDAAGYRKMVLKGATRMSQNRMWAPYAATLMLFVNKLSAMTFDQNRGDLFLRYCEEHLEAHKGEGLYSGDRPMDPQILEETVLSQKSLTNDGPMATLEARLEKKFEESAVSERSLRDMVKTEQAKNSTLLRKMEALEKQVEQGKADPAKNRGPPSDENPCSYCGSGQHFVRECPKRAAYEDEKARRKKKEAEAKQEEEK